MGTWEGAPRCRRREPQGSDPVHATLHARRDDFLNVLVAQRSLYASEEAYVQSTRNTATDLIALYKALGGAWRSARRENEMSSMHSGHGRAKSGRVEMYVSTWSHSRGLTREKERLASVAETRSCGADEEAPSRLGRRSGCCRRASACGVPARRLSDRAG